MSVRRGLVWELPEPPLDAVLARDDAEVRLRFPHRPLADPCLRCRRLDLLGRRLAGGEVVEQEVLRPLRRGALTTRVLEQLVGCQRRPADPLDAADLLAELLVDP